jgi:hypothetical protein
MRRNLLQRSSGAMAHSAHNCHTRHTCYLALGDFVMPRGDIIPTRGAIAEPLVLEVTREITGDDLRRMGEAPAVGVPMVQKLRAVHHRQAQLLASGKTHGQVAAIVGCTVQRLVQLQQDAAFKDLVEYYKDQIMVLALEDGARLRDKIIDVGEMAVDELRERLENDEVRKRMRTGDVRQIAEFAMDRTVAPPKAAPNAASPPAAVTINFGTTLRPEIEDAPVPMRQYQTIEVEVDPIVSPEDLL